MSPSLARPPFPRVWPIPDMWRVLTAILGSLGCVFSASAQPHQMEAAPRGLVEAGAPPFVIIGDEALGLDSPATDLRQMPDGRILVIASQQLALGDGVRWEVFRQDSHDPIIASGSVAVDRDGKIYVGVPKGFARVEFGENNLWHLVRVALWPAAESANRPPPHTQLTVDGEWFWHAGSGSILTWRPGQTAQIAGTTEDLQHIFSLHGAFYVSDRSDGSLARLKAGKKEAVFPDREDSPNSAITCSVPLGDSLILVGTFARGLQEFDGHTIRPFGEESAVFSHGPINDLCATAGGMFAAAVENHGIVFFNRTGHTVQSLDRSLDHRLSRVKRLLPAANGVIWALLDHGIMRVEFPSRISFFEPLLGSGVNTAHPDRLDGRLWFLADGKIQRAVYDADERLAKIEDDTPENLYIFGFSGALGLPVAGTEKGAFYRSSTGWEPFAPEISNLRILDPQPRDGRWLYGARGEIGWLKLTQQGIQVERLPTPALANAYNTVVAGNGDIWIEMGLGRFGRVKWDGQGAPRLETFSTKDGIPESWGQVFEIKGVVRFNVAEQIFRFDEGTRRFVEDTEFQAILPDDVIRGRPGMDFQGRLWVSTNAGVKILDRRGAQWRQVDEKMSPQFRPYYFTFEKDGVVWLHSEHRLERFDPNIPTPPVTPLHALFTHVTIATNNRTFYDLDRPIPSLKFSENSLVVHYAAVGNPYASAITFEVKLEGTGGDWTPTGSSGSAVFNGLKEGHYLLHVRPRSEAAVGTEATLGFSISPPWYRTYAAYGVYILSALALVLLAGWMSTILERRENTRLEQLVAQRTHELNASNDRLANQVDEILMLSQAIEQSPVAVFITKPDGTIVFANPRACEITGYPRGELLGMNAALLRTRQSSAHEAAPAAAQRGESWRGELVNRDKAGRVMHVQSMISPIRSPDGVIRHHLILEEDITDWLADQEKNRLLEAQLFQAQKLESIGTLAGGIAHDFNNILTGILGYCELARLNAGEGTELQRDLNEVRAAGLRAKELVAQILTFSRQSNASLVPVNLAEPVNEAVRLIRATTPATINIVAQIENGIVKADATQIQQVVLNLCTNAIHAMSNRAGRLNISLQAVNVTPEMAALVPHLSAGRRFRLVVSDTGDGMDPSTLNRIFDPFFTTKRQGEGTGLGLAIVQGIVVGHGGALQVRSTPSAGSVFEIYFQFTEESVPTPTAEVPAPRGQQQEIIIVDDERSVATFASTRLQQLGYLTTVFTEPGKVIEAFAQEPDRYQAIVTDLTMPHLTGADLIQQIRSRGWLIPAVIITGYGGDTLNAKLGLLPRCLVLQKPFTGEDLARALDQVLNDYSLRT
jgi:PAS domain S-box-containing protein